MRVLRKVKLKVKQQGKLKGNNFINFPTPPQKLIVIPDGIWDPKIIILDFVIIGRGVGLGGEARSPGGPTSTPGKAKDASSPPGNANIVQK